MFRAATIVSVSAIFVFPLFGCTATKEEPYTPYDTSGEYRANFSHSCSLKNKDEFGDAAYRHCTVSVTSPDYKTPIGPLRMNYETLMIIDLSGIHLLRPKKSHPACDTSPQRIAIDEKRIDQQPESSQIEELLRGQKLVWEEQSKWPYCVVSPHATSLLGLRDEVDAAKEKSWPHLRRQLSASHQPPSPDNPLSSDDVKSPKLRDGDPGAIADAEHARLVKGQQHNVSSFRRRRRDFLGAKAPGDFRAARFRTERPPKPQLLEAGQPQELAIGIGPSRWSLGTQRPRRLRKGAHEGDWRHGSAIHKSVCAPASSVTRSNALSLG